MDCTVCKEWVEEVDEFGRCRACRKQEIDGAA